MSNELDSRADLVLVRVVSLRALRHTGSPVAFAGIVEAVGEHVTMFQPRDAVFGIADGAFAGYVCTRQDRLAPKPAGLPFDDAATLAALHAAPDYTP